MFKRLNRFSLSSYFIRYTMDIYNSLFFFFFKCFLNYVDCCAYTPLHWAVHSGAAELVRSFTTRAIERTLKTTEEDSQGRPVLQIAIEYWNIDHTVGRNIQKLLTVPEVKNEVERLYRYRKQFVDSASALILYFLRGEKHDPLQNGRY
ncbi:hypothetical protein R1flu_009415 [Riccia fluitans]|uniref:ANK_REP_REGION domain-containing protein n=1 Tax=Riccia fluitans TaxID=41844 RepID=A0ABD1Z266_9MARC